MFYEINENYMRFLYDNIDQRVLIHNIDKKTRKFIALHVLLNGYHYFIPLSSPDESDYVMIKGKRVVRKTNVPTIKRLFDDGNKNEITFIGKLLFNNMIPVPQGYYQEYDLNHETDFNYKNLLTKQMRIIKTESSLKDIERRAKTVYRLKNSSNSAGFIKATVDFKKLEEASLIWLNKPN